MIGKLNAIGKGLLSRLAWQSQSLSLNLNLFCHKDRVTQKVNPVLD